MLGDREAESSTAELAIDGPICLVECGENLLLLFLGDSDPGVRNREYDAVIPFRPDAQPNLSGLGKFERVRQQIL